MHLEKNVVAHVNLKMFEYVSWSLLALVDQAEDDNDRQATYISTKLC